MRNLERPKSFETGPGLGPSSSSSLVSDVNGLVELVVSAVNGLPELIHFDELILLGGSSLGSSGFHQEEASEGPDAGGGVGQDLVHRQGGCCHLPPVPLLISWARHLFSD